MPPPRSSSQIACARRRASARRPARPGTGPSCAGARAARVRSRTSAAGACRAPRSVAAPGRRGARRGAAPRCADGASRSPEPTRRAVAAAARCARSCRPRASLLRSFQMLFAFLRPGKIISLAILVAIVGGVWWAWGRLHRSEPASASAALAAVRDAKGDDDRHPGAGVYHTRRAATSGSGSARSPSAASSRRTRCSWSPPSPNSRFLDLRLSSDHSEGWRIQTSDAGVKGIARTIRVGTLGYTREVSGNAVPPVLLRPAKFRRGLKWQSVYKVGAIVFRRESAVVDRETQDDRRPAGAHVGDPDEGDGHRRPPRRRDAQGVVVALAGPRRARRMAPESRRDDRQHPVRDSWS